ncbi:membrane protein insertion efficiency factor YidD [Actinotalea sp. K2]|uniref:membrane protein insertion efficiency factor YidD n=1 Tax=Actinotalea sp. K2 TaxID=2939438 RepID=UPI002017A758|nr:membrane protein insertion efficiency factor YidD [Actinotalea sp. K2]MCL3860755.1 membrane protein insertion efficiency factor YidD [Actinotalea sp. K2]
MSSSSTVLRRLGRLPGAVILGLLRFYQVFISPLSGPTCRYYPSCSQYAVTAVRRHGALRGTWLALRRLGRCHPWTAGGVDDVPPARDPRTSARSDGSDDRLLRSTAR